MRVRALLAHANCPDHLESVQFRHVHVQEQEIEVGSVRMRQCLPAVAHHAHRVAALHEQLPHQLADRLEIHHAPKHGSWLDMAEIELSAMARDLPDRVGDRPAFVAHVAAWERRRNDAGVKADWQFTTADARVKLRKLYPTVDG